MHVDSLHEYECAIYSDIAHIKKLVRNDASSLGVARMYPVNKVWWRIALSVWVYPEMSGLAQ